MLSRSGERDAISFPHVDSYEVSRSQSFNSFDSRQQCPIPQHCITRTGNKPECYDIGCGLMELEIVNAFASPHQVSEELPMNDPSVWKNKVIADTTYLKIHEREIIAAQTIILNKFSAILVSIANERHHIVTKGSS